MILYYGIFINIDYNQLLLYNNIYMISILIAYLLVSLRLDKAIEEYEFIPARICPIRNNNKYIILKCETKL
jgi:hypothetical protein